MTVSESIVLSGVNVLTTETTAVSPWVIELVAVVEEPSTVRVSPMIVPAFDGAVPNIPRLKVTTTANAMRLKLVFVDICILSKVVIETFSITAGKEILAS